MKKRYLFIFSLFLLSIYLSTQFSTLTSVTQFKTSLFQLDTAAVSQILIRSKSTRAPIQFYRSPTGWQVNYDEVTTDALTETVNDLLTELHAVQTVRVATNQPTEWENFGVEETALQIQIIQADQPVERLLLGGRKQQIIEQPDTTFARLPNENEVYALQRFNRQIFARPFSYYRQQIVLQIADNQKINQIELSGKDTLQRNGKTWQNRKEVRIDSLQIEDYLSELRYVEASAFADDFDETQRDFLPYQQLLIRGDNIIPAIQIQAYYDSTAHLPFIVHSSQFPSTFYASDSSGVYQQLFGMLTDSLLNVE